MRGKLLFITGAAVGFVLGSRQGRQAYERIKSKAGDVWTDPKVRDGVHKAASLAKDKLPGGEKIAEAVHKAEKQADEAVAADDESTAKPSPATAPSNPS